MTRKLSGAFCQHDVMGMVGERLVINILSNSCLFGLRLSDAPLEMVFLVQNFRQEELAAKTPATPQEPGQALDFESSLAFTCGEDYQK